jgi:GNAT superfamily N-acetyltransferase
MNQFSIDRAGTADRTVISELFAADMATLGSDVSAEDLLPLVDNALEKQGEGAHVWAARQGDEVVGVLLAAPFLSLKVAGPSLWIEELYVRPDARRQGLGRLMVEELLDWAESSGFKGVELEAYHMNTGASVLYRSVGFRRLARERYCYYYGIDDA